MKDQTLTIQEAAKFLGVSTKTLRRWDMSGRLKPERTVGNQRRYTLSELQAFQLSKQTTIDPVEVPQMFSTPNHVSVAQDAVAIQEKSAATEEPQFPGIVDVQVPQVESGQTDIREENIDIIPSEERPAAEETKPQPFGLGAARIQNPSEDSISKDDYTEAKGIKLNFFSHPRYSMALAGAVAILLLLFTFGFINAQNMQDAERTAQNKAVLAAADRTPQIVLRVNVPSVFGKPATFLDSVKIAKGLTVDGVATLSGGIVTNNADINAGTGKLTASNVVYSVLAGSNITITGDPQNPTIAANFGTGLVSSFQGQTGAVALAQGSGIGLDGLTITNTGVLSVQGQSGAVTFSGGSGVSVTGTTINNTDPGSAQNIFKSIIAGSTTIDADSNDDSVTFAAGSGITITGDTGSKTVTITSNASGTLSGLTTNGVLYATDPNNASSTVAGTTGTVLKGITAGAPVFGAVDLSSDVTGTLSIGRGGTGLTTTPTNGQLLIGNGAGYSLTTLTAGAGIGVGNGAGTISLTNNGVLSVTGTANQITTSGSTGAITLSLPQDIATTSTPTFASMTLTANTNQLTLGSGNTGVITLATLTGGRTYTLPDASGEICLDTGNCPGGGGGTIGGSGSAGYLPRFTNATTLANSLLYDTGTKVGIGTTSPEGLFSVSGGVAGQALVSLNETGNQDILVGSASGTTRFVFDRAGNLSINGGAYMINGSNVLSSTTLGSSVTASSLTSVSTLNAGSIGIGFGSIDVGTDAISGGDFTSTGATGITIAGNGAGIGFSGTGNHVITASSGVLQFGAATLTGAITGNGQNITGLSNLSASGTITFGGLSTGIVKSNGSGVLSSSAVGLNTSDVTGTLGVTNGGTGLNSYNAGDLIYASGANTLAARAIGTNGQILTVSGGMPVWADPGGLVNFWQRANGAVSPLNVTDDFIIGGNATASARFQISGTTGNASTSGSLTFNTPGSFQTTANQTFTIGGATTGNITLAPLNGNGVVNITGDLNLASGKVFQINGSSVLTASTLGSSIINSSLTSVGALASGSIANGFGTIATSNTITGTTLNGTTGINTGAGAGTQRIDTNGNLVNINNLNASGTITFGGLATNNGLLYTNGSGVVSQAAAGTSGQLLVANGSGVPTFVTLSSDATLAANGTLTIGADAVALGTDTTGNYIATLTSGNGISSTATGEGSTPTVALGALSANWDQTGAFDIVLNNAASELSILESSGNTYFGSIDIGDLSANRAYTFPDSTGTVCLVEAGNCAGSGSGVTTPGGTTSRLVRFTGSQSVGDASINDLYASGVALTIDAIGRLGVGTTSPTGLLTVSGGSFGGNAAAVFNQTGASSNDIITASASGSTKFTVNNNGNLQFAGNTSFLNTLTSLATQNRTYTLPDAAGTICLVEAGNCAGSGGGLTGSGTAGQIAFFNGTGTLTSEASGFAWDAVNNRLGVGNNTPTGVLDVSGANVGKALVIFNETGNQNIFTASGSGTTVANLSRTGNFAITGELSNLTGATLTVDDFFNLSSGKAYQIAGSGVLTETALGSSVVSSSLTSVGALTSGSIASGFGTIATSNTITGTTLNGTTGINTGAGAGTLRIDNNGNLSNIGTINASGALTFGNYTTNGGLLYTNGSGVVGQTGAGTAGQILQSNAGGAPTWVDANTLGTNYWQRIAGTVSPLNIGDDLLVGGTATSSARFQIFANSGNATMSGTLTFNTTGTVQTTRNQSLTIGGATTGNITLSPLNGNGTVTSTGDLNLSSGKGYQINGANVLTSTALGSSVVSSSLTSVGALTGGSIASGFGTIATTNTITGTTLNGTTGINTGAGAGTLRIDTNGNLSNIGTIDSTYLDATGNNVNLAASTNLQFNGTTVIDSSRNLSNISGLSTSLNPTVANTYALGTGAGNQFSTIYGQTVYQNGNQVCDTTGNCSGLSVNFWDQANGIINPKNTTVDFLVGGNATASAKFAVLNVNSGTPTASVSAGAAGAAYLTAAGTLQTTAQQTLTIGGLTTGNIVLSPQNGSGTVTSTGSLNLASGKEYLINGSSVLTSTTLGSSVVSSSLTSVGALTGGSIASGFGTIATANTITGTTINGTTGINTGAGAGTLRIDNNGNLSNIGTINASGAVTFSNLGQGIVKSSAGGLLSSSALNLASGTEVTGTLGVGNGGTGFASYATGDILVGNGSSTLSKLTIGGDGQILSIAGGTPTWISSSSLNYWQRANGAIAPLNITDDLLLGSTATTSAKFAFKNVAGGTPTASISANAGNNALYIQGDGTIATTNMQRLNFGSTSTGGFNFQAGNESTNAFNVKSAAGNNMFTVDTTNSRAGFFLGGNNVPSLTNQGIELQGALRLSGGGSTTYMDTFTTPQGGSVLTKINIPLFNPGAAGQILAFGLPSGAATNSRGISLFDNRAVADNQPVLSVFSPDENNVFGLSWDGSNSNTYLKVTGANNIGIKANGNTITNFLSTGNVGIGTSAPVSSLEVTRPLGTFAASGKALAIFNQTENQDIFTASASGTTRFVIKNNGTVGIGTANPNDTLEVSGSFRVSDPADSTHIFKVNPVSGYAANFPRTLFQGGDSSSDTNWVTRFANAYSSSSNNIPAGIQFTTNNDANYANAEGLQIMARSNKHTISSFTGSSGNGLAIQLDTAGPDNSTTNPNLFLDTVANGATVGIGTVTPLARLDVRGGIGTQPIASFSGQTARVGLLVDNNGVGDLFTASKSGASKFTILNNGNVRINNLANCNTIDTDANGILSCGTDDGAGIANYWQLNNGALAQGNLTTDLLLGSTATTSAKFAFMNVNSGTPTASISANAGNNAAYLTGLGVLGTTNAQTLTLGSSSTGNVVLAPGGAAALTTLANGRVGIGTSLPGARFDVASAGNALTDYTARFSSSPSVAGAGGVLFDQGSTNAYKIHTETTGAADGFLKFSYINQSTGAVINDNNLVLRNGRVGIGNDNPQEALTVNGGALIGTAADRVGAGLSVRGSASDQYVAEFFGRDASYAGFGVYAEASGAKPFIQFADNAGTSGIPSSDWTINSDDSNFYFRPGNILAVPALSLNSIQAAAGRASLAIGAGSAAHLATLDIRNSVGTAPTASFSGATSRAGLLVDNSGVGDIFTASKSGLTRFTIRNNGDVAVGALTDYTNLANAQGFTSNLTVRGGLQVGEFNARGSVVLIPGSGGTDSGIARFYDPYGNSYGSISGNNSGLSINGTNLYLAMSKVGIGVADTVTPFATFDVRSQSGTLPVASLSGQTSNASLLVDQSGTGDLFAASKSGATKFVVRNNGDIYVVANQIMDTLTTGTLGIGTTNATTLTLGRSGQNIALPGYNNCGMLTTSGTTLTCSSAPGAVTQYVRLANGAFSFVNDTADFLVGSNASSSAKFAVLNVNSGTPTASISGASNNATSLTATGVLGTTNAQTLQLGNASTGNVNLSPGGSAALTALANGRVGIGTAAPGYALDIQSGDLNIGGNDLYLNGNLRISDSLSGTLTTFRPQNGILALSDGVNNQSLYVYGANATSNLRFFANNTTSGLTTNTSTLPLTLQSNGGSVGINTFAPLATLDIRGNLATTPFASLSGQSTNAGFIVDNSGTGDLFTASKSGATKFAILNNGDVRIANLSAAGGVLYTNGTGTVAQTAQGTSGECLQSSGVGGAPVWGACDGAGSVDAFTMANGLIYNGNQTMDFAFGGTSSASAKFKISISGTNPTASVSGRTANAALVVDNNGVGDLFTASSSGLTRFIIGQNGNVISRGTALSQFQVQTASGTTVTNVDTVNSRLEITGTSFDANVANSYALAVNGSYISLGDPLGGQTFANGIGIKFNDSGVSHGSLKYTSNASTPRFDFCNSFNTSALTCDSNTETLSILSGTAGQVGINTTNPLAAFDVRGRIGTLPIASFSGQTSNAGFIVDNNGVGDLFTASKSGATKFTITNAGVVGIGQFPRTNLSTTPAGTLHLWGLGVNGSNAILNFGDQANTSNPYIKENGTGDSDILEVGGRLGLTFATGTNGSYGFERMRIDANGNVLINTTSALATFDVRGISGTNAVASVSGTTSRAAFIVDNNGVGDLFTASKSGATKFAVKNNGDIQFAGTSNFLNTISTLATAARNYIFPDLDGTVCLSTSTGCIPGATNYWQLNNGAIAPFSNTADVLIGNTATNSAKFGFLNVNTGIPTASISANTANNATYLSGNGVLSTTNKQTLTLGSSSTGNILLGTDANARAITIGNTTGTTALNFQSGSGVQSFDSGATSGTAYDMDADLLTSGTGLSIESSGSLLTSGTLFSAQVNGAGSFENFSGDLAKIAYTQNIFSTTFSGNLLDVARSLDQAFIGTGSVTGAVARLSDAATVSTGSLTHSADVLQITQSYTGNTGAALNVSTAGTGYVARFNDDGTLTDTTAFIIDATGNVGVGTTTALAKLDVRGGTATAPAASLSASSTNATLIVDNNGTGDVLTASKSGKSFFTVKNNGVIQMGNSSDGISFDYLSTTGTNTGIVYAGRARPTKQIVLSPEYAGGILTASGSATTDGDITAEASASATALITLNGVANNYLTYYEWSSAETSLQDYTVGVRVTLPADFSSWAPGGSSIQVVYNTELGTSTSNKLDMIIYPSNSSTPTVYRQAQNSASKTWTTVDIPATDLNDGTPWNAASQSAMLYFKMSSKDNNHVQLGDIILNYLSKF